MPTLLVKNIHTLVTMNDARDEIRRASLFIRGNVIEQAGLSYAFGGIDVSRNIYKDNPAAIEKTGKFRPFYKFHLWVLAPFEQAQQAKQTMKGSLSTGISAKPTATKVPLRVGNKPYDGHEAGVAYALKTEFFRRYTIPAHEDNGERAPQNTRDKPLTIDEKVQLAVMLHMLGSGGRLFLHNISIRTNKNGDPIFKILQND